MPAENRNVRGNTIKPHRVESKEVDAEEVSTEEFNTSRTWKTVTDSRAFDVTETNNTESEIKAKVAIDSNSNETSVVITGSIAGNSVYPLRTELDNDQRIIIQLDGISPGQNYKLAAFGDTASYEINRWNEFRP